MLTGVVLMLVLIALDTPWPKQPVDSSNQPRLAKGLQDLIGK